MRLENTVSKNSWQYGVNIAPLRVLAVASSILISAGPAYSQQQDSYRLASTIPSVKEYIEANKNTIVKKLEECHKTKIEIPLVLYFPEDKHKLSKGLQGLTISRAFVYLPGIQSVIVDDNHIPVHTSNSPHLYISDGRNAQSLDGLFSHEIGHHYLLLAAIELDGQHKLHRSFISAFTFGKSIISEGTAEYMRIKCDPAATKESRTWPVRLSGLYDLAARKIKGTPPTPNYGFSHDFVRPILDSLGLGKGINAMLGNPAPTKKELLDPDAYQQNIINGARFKTN